MTTTDHEKVPVLLLHLSMLLQFSPNDLHRIGGHIMAGTFRYKAVAEVDTLSLRSWTSLKWKDLDCRLRSGPIPSPPWLPYHMAIETYGPYVYLKETWPFQSFMLAWILENLSAEKNDLQKLAPSERESSFHILRQKLRLSYKWVSLCHTVKYIAALH